MFGSAVIASTPYAGILVTGAGRRVYPYCKMDGIYSNKIGIFTDKSDIYSAKTGVYSDNIDVYTPFPKGNC